MSDAPQAAPSLATLEPAERLRLALVQAALTAWMSRQGAMIPEAETGRIRDELRRGQSDVGPTAAERFGREFVAAWAVTTGCCALCGGPTHPGAAYPCPLFPPPPVDV